MTAKAVSQYLARHAEPVAAAAERIDGEFAHAIVVPAYGEEQSLFDTLGSVPRGPAGETLIVVVLNARADSPPEVHRANDAARERLRAESSAVDEIAEIDGDGASILAYPHGKLVLIDRAAPGRFLPEGQGVGLARKLGNDLALALCAAGRLTAAWIHNTDADTILPNDYFDQTADVPADGNAAALYFFEHRFGSDETLALAARLYEISLRYMTLGLAWAGSPYAYESMGSCLAIRPGAYAAVRGFPHKNAAEDFYVLNKLAKVGTIERLVGAPLLLEGRISRRVPFGTGRALSDMVSGRRGLAEFRMYHPGVFAHLSAWLRVLAALADSGGRMDEALGGLPHDNPFFLGDLLVEALDRMGALAAVREALGSGETGETLRRRLHTWFDAFRTVKLLHALRDGGLPSLPWREALAEAPFTGLTTSTVDGPEPLRRILAAEEAKLSATPTGVPTV